MPLGATAGQLNRVLRLSPLIVSFYGVIIKVIAMIMLVPGYEQMAHSTAHEIFQSEKHANYQPALQVNNIIEGSGDYLLLFHVVCNQ